MVFQDPYGSLNPRKTVGRQLADPIRIHGLRTAQGSPDRVRELLDLVACRPTPPALSRMPSAAASASGSASRAPCPLEPECLLADEPVSALDVSVQAQIVNLLLELQERCI